MVRFFLPPSSPWSKRRSLTQDPRCFAQHSMDERVPVPLAIHHSPMCLTFAFFGEECVSPRPSLTPLPLSDPPSPLL